jgi:hypothetical protein
LLRSGRCRRRCGRRGVVRNPRHVLWPSPGRGSSQYRRRRSQRAWTQLGTGRRRGAGGPTVAGCRAAAARVDSHGHRHAVRFIRFLKVTHDLRQLRRVGRRGTTGRSASTSGPPPRSRPAGTGIQRRPTAVRAPAEDAPTPLSANPAANPASIMANGNATAPSTPVGSTRRTRCIAEVAFVSVGSGRM